MKAPRESWSEILSVQIHARKYYIKNQRKYIYQENFYREKFAPSCPEIQ